MCIKINVFPRQNADHKNVQERHTENNEIENIKQEGKKSFNQRREERANANEKSKS